MPIVSRIPHRFSTALACGVLALSLLGSAAATITFWSCAAKSRAAGADATATAAAEMLATALDAMPVVNESVALASLTESGPIHAVVYRNDAGQVISEAARGPGLIDGLRSAPTSTEHPIAVQRIAAAGGHGSFVRVDLRRRVHGELRRISALTAAPPQSGSGWDIVRFAMVVTVVPLLFAGAVFIWLRRRIVRPLANLHAAAAGGPRTPPSKPTHGASDDAFGDIHRALADLRLEADRWRREAQRVERQLDTQVAERTKKISRELDRAKRAMWEDPLTGVTNRRFLDERFADIFDAQRDAGGDLSVVMLDLDHFKQLNDTLGHRAGDALLRFVGTLVRHSIRDNDTAIRYGGDEFMLILPGVSQEHANGLGRRVAALFTQHAALLRGLPVRPAISVGVASLREDRPGSSSELIALADRRMYAHKHLRSPNSRSAKSALPPPRDKPARPPSGGSLSRGPTI